MPWQRSVVDVALEVQSEAAGDPAPGEWAYQDITATIQRQAGKTTLLQPVVAHRLGSWERCRVFSTAQKREKARARWMDTTDTFLTSPLKDKVRRKTARMGEELRWVETMSTFVPFAPNDDDMHGETPDLVLVDELWAFTHEMAKSVQAAYVPGFTTKDAQAWKLSTAGTEKSWWLNTARRAGRRAVESGVRLGVAYFEWSLPERMPDGRPLRLLSDEEIVEACIAYHPANGYTLRPASLRAAWDQMGGDRAEFLRAYGNVTQADLAARWTAIDEATWLGGLEKDLAGIPGDAPVAFGVWVDEDGDDACVSAGWRDQAGVMHTELLMHGKGSARSSLLDSPRKVVPFLQGLTTRPLTVAVANVGPARDVGDEIEAAGIPVLRVSQADVTAACARHRSALADKAWKHRLSTEATEAAAGAGWRLGRWERLDESISALGAQTMAGWGFDHAPEPEPTRPPFWMG